MERKAIKQPIAFIIDDCHEIIVLLKLLLEGSTPFRVVTARSYQEAKEKAFDVLQSAVAIIDINLGIDQPTGLDVFEWLRGSGYGGQIAFLTGHANSHPTVAEALAIGDVDVFMKPIPSERLIDFAQASLRKENV